MRYRPLMILMHLSAEGRNPLITLFTGAVEGVILIVLTVFFEASWGGNPTGLVLRDACASRDYSGTCPRFVIRCPKC